MKKAMVYICALSLALSALLAGCGDMRRTDGGDPAPTPTPAPEVTVLPEDMMPDVADGEVRDRDGFITEGDNGTDSDAQGKGIGNRIWESRLPLSSPALR